MSIKVGLWRIDQQLKAVTYSTMESEKRLEEIIAEDITVVESDLLLIGRQVVTAHGKFIDLLALDSEGRLVVIELKKNKTPREVVAQLLDYGSWVRNLNDDDIAEIWGHYTQKYLTSHNNKSLDESFQENFSGNTLPEVLNDSHKLILVAGSLDDSTERIIEYLAEEYGVSINAVFFGFFKDQENEYLSRAWLADPNHIDAAVEEKREKEPWNGEYYATFGDGLGRSWEDARRYGFISAGGGIWYSQTLALLEPGGRVWVNLSGGRGYVGVGIVESYSIPYDEFKVNDSHGKLISISKTEHTCSYHVEESRKDSTKAEHFVKINWLKSLSMEDAIKEKGLFGIQHSAARPRAKKWLHTIQRLKIRFKLTD